MVWNCRRVNFLCSGNCFKQESLFEKRKKKSVGAAAQVNNMQKTQAIHFVPILLVQNPCKYQMPDCKFLDLQNKC